MDRSQQAKGLICEYRQRMQHLAQKELQRALQKLAQGENQQHVLSEFGERLVNKLTIIPVPA